MIGDRTVQVEADMLQAKEVLVIVRTPGVVVYAHLPIVAMELAGNLQELAKGLTSFRAISATADLAGCAQAVVAA